MKRILFLAIAAILMAFQGADAKRMSDLKIYINPGHGGYTGDDRPIHLYPFEKNDTLGYWESKSNLYKGLHMYHILDSLGATPMLSRIKNTQEDDRSLSSISAEANNFGADLFFSIHSNAGETVNYPLMLYREQTIGTPRYPENVTLSQILGNNLYSNKLTIWTNPLQIAGDLTFYQNMWSGGLGVLRGLYVVGLLSEGGMHEHRPEAYRLMNDDYWWLEAWHFVRAIMEFYNTEDRFVTGNVAGIVYDDHNLREKDMEVRFTRHGRDIYAPINGCLVELLDKDGNVVQKRTTDNIYNGVFVFRNVTPGTYTLRTSHDEYYQAEATVEVVANEVTYNDLPLSMRREFPLEVVSRVPNDEQIAEPLSCATVLEFTFNSDIDVESFKKALTIEPAIDGFFTFENNNHVAKFTPSVSFERNTKYTVTLDNTVCHPDKRYANNNLQQPLTFEFTTADRMRLEVLDHFPATNGEVHYATPVVEVRFDYPVTSSGIYDYISIRDSKNNPLSIAKTNYKFNSLGKDYGNIIISPKTQLTPGETYTLRITDDIRDKENLPMLEDLTFSFKAVDITDGIEELSIFNDFEKTAPFELVEDMSSGYTGTQSCATNSSIKLYGSKSACFKYRFADTRNGSLTWKYNGESNMVLQSSDKIGLFVYGDFNHHPVYIGVTAGTDVKWLKVTDLDFVGWRYFTVDLSELDPSFSYILWGFKMDQVDSPMCTKGAFYIDNLAASSLSGIDDITADGVDAPATYYNLQGIEVAAPGPGIYIEKRGGVARKIEVK